MPSATYLLSHDRDHFPKVAKGLPSARYFLSCERKYPKNTHRGLRTPMYPMGSLGRSVVVKSGYCVSPPDYAYYRPTGASQSIFLTVGSPIGRACVCKNYGLGR